jgi:uncharacterized protein YjiS (DUF1127 family)
MPALLAINRASHHRHTRAALTGAALFSRCLGQRACACVWANQKKDNPMFLVSLLASVSRWLRYRDTVRQLSDLSDRELRDLGIHRGDIHATAWSGR